MWRLNSDIGQEERTWVKEISRETKKYFEPDGKWKTSQNLQIIGTKLEEICSIRCKSLDKKKDLISII